MGAKGLLSHRDPSFLPWSRKEESQGAIMGVKGQGAPIYVYIGLRAQFEEKPSSTRQGRGQREWSAIKSDTSDHSMEDDKH